MERPVQFSDKMEETLSIFLLQMMNMWLTQLSKLEIGLTQSFSIQIKGEIWKLVEMEEIQFTKFILVTMKKLWEFMARTMHMLEAWALSYLFDWIV